jgi:methionyl-tRNA synthetase
LRFVEGGLHDLSVSRTSFTWGIPVPNDPSHIMYVWLDALTYYLTALGYPDQKIPDYDAFWASCLHVLGKDILRFHAVYWPAFLMAAGIKPPRRVFAHGWWTNEGEKISKSRNNVIDPLPLVETFGRDAMRYFMLREIPFGNDGDFSRKNLIGRLNSDLANSYGNLVQRVLSFIAKTCGGIVPTPQEITPADQDLLKQVGNILPILRKEIHAQALHKVCEHIWRLIGEANRYVDEQKPWSLKTENPERMGTVLYVLAEAIRQIAILTQSIVPEASARILDQLAISREQRAFSSLAIPLVPGIVLPPPEGVFPRFTEEN